MEKKSICSQLLVKRKAFKYKEVVGEMQSCFEKLGSKDVYKRQELNYSALVSLIIPVQ